ncbi:MAG TPA: DNA-primase RepB domain-containing protein [Gallionella sp.]|nr:DNA-primase RepB domain-containing protein [Gallionella sp.]
MTEIAKIQAGVLRTIQKEVGVKAWHFGSRSSTGLWRQKGVQVELVDAGLAWARKANARGSDTYFRPAQSEPAAGSCVAYRYFFLDDLPEALARDIASMNRALIVRTSIEGGCQAWIFTSELLTADQRQRVQKDFALKLGADVGATSGIQFGRLPGTKNHKRAGQWANVLVTPRGQRFSVAHILEDTFKPIRWSGEKVHGTALSNFPSARQRRQRSEDIADVSTGDQLGSNNASFGDLEELEFAALATEFMIGAGGDRSRADFQACIRLLSAGANSEQLVDAVAGSAGRKGRQARKYAERTVRKALEIMLPK